MLVHKFLLSYTRNGRLIDGRTHTALNIQHLTLLLISEKACIAVQVTTLKNMEEMEDGL